MEQNTNIQPKGAHEYILPFQIWSALSWFPIILVILLSVSSYFIRNIIQNSLIQFINTDTSTKDLSPIMLQNAFLIAKVIPYLIIMPLIFIISSYPARLTFIKSKDIHLFDNFKVISLSVGVCIKSYLYSLRASMWYAIPLIAVLLTDRIAVHFIPGKYFDIYVYTVYSFVLLSLYRALPVLLSPLCAVIGLYEPYHAIQVSAVVYNRTYLKIIFYITVGSLITYYTPYYIFELLWFYVLSVVSVIYVKQMALIEFGR